jgi:hypothetical protein
LGGLLALAGGIAAWSSQIGRGNRAAERTAPIAVQTAFAQLGPGSCSARACHGNVEATDVPTPKGRPRAVAQNEYITWMTADRHAKAYDVLDSERSRTIAQNLKASTPAGVEIPAYEDGRCLACHAIPSLATQGSMLPQLARDGVSCEACHGPAEKWLAAHTLAQWKSTAPEVKEASFGFVALDDVATRAGVCVGCHVGAPPDPQRGIPARDANHEIMAAGHPRLVFEFWSYQAMMPPHWNDKKDKESTFPARVWAAGQAAALKAALDLLAYRAESAARDQRPWPEFAEYDCFACHHDLQASASQPLKLSWRQERGFRRTPGSPPWGTWYLPMHRLLAAHAAPPELAGQLESIEQLMSEPMPKAGDVAAQARAAARTAGRLAAKLADAQSYDLKSIESLLGSVAGQDAALVASSWDTAVQHLVAIAALHRAVLDAKAAARQPMSDRDRQLETAIDKLRDALELPPTHESPATFEPQRVAEFWQELSGLLGAGQPPAR